ncbi:uncharacterized protein LOC131929380 isoform X1 [Physella acuta]|uniref:uncharacterized protein LOC131929380 isoform X1 n=2 Tax=Physella acuta TaxID=109671 RepID=UPI0027DBDF1B|nr:uncharacterized protein LOC131929380 isoform X1 [Physella acuta]XP_059141520.1 uncharacterized protein LOC131929380 isoform X1 [Physella acuta]XP_059141521.1 uncharacterized protein LOC131929380 isoform X1 [Physella acuta]XP_059141522.1 uncharacterized protein LOC131929380 isoform X1 [Physella acuta]
MPQTVVLSPFQKEKLQYYFKFLEPNQDGVLESHSFDRVMQKIYKFTGWPKDNHRALQCVEIHQAFFEILFEKSEAESGHHGTATLDDWYAIWSHILPGCKGMSNFPVWLRLMPKVLFDMMDRNNDDVLTSDEIFQFYKEMVDLQVDLKDLETSTHMAYSKMTDNGRYPLTLDSYEQVFANFLLGRTPHGPGKYIFGCFKHDYGSYQLIQPAEDDPSDDMFSYDKRPKKFGVAFT